MNARPAGRRRVTTLLSRAPHGGEGRDDRLEAHGVGEAVLERGLEAARVEAERRQGLLELRDGHLADLVGGPGLLLSLVRGRRGGGLGGGLGGGGLLGLVGLLVLLI